MRCTFVFLLTAYCLPFTAQAQSTGGAKGKVRNNRDEAIADVSVTARKDSKDISTVTTNKKGEFAFNNLETGVYNFVFDKVGYASAIRYNIEVRPNKKVDLGDRLILVVDKGTLVLIQGSVFFKDGTSVTGAKVEVEKLNADGTTRSFPAVYTNISGEFTYRQPEGTAKYRFTAKYKDRTASKVIEVSSAAIYRIALNFDISRSDK
ncbi:MAG: carboxypeptidase regulatory-like domain-containing protein [Chloracidobacterium sp.]|nr:carboxypeptidase regulatory-like domain-containing protein [Chloracidobacterium sp.]